MATPLELVPAPGLAGPVVLIDLDIVGRQSGEVTEPGYVAWPVPEGASAAKTVEGVTFTLAKAGSTGSGLTSVWQKAVVQAPNYARLAGDGVTVEGGGSGSQIRLTLKGLAAGRHALLTVHNVPNGSSGGKIDVAVDGAAQVNDLSPTSGVLANDAAATSYVAFDATGGKDVVLTYTASGPLYVNTLELDVPNRAAQAQNPSPSHNDEHVAADDGSLTLSWDAAPGTASHDVYFGTDPNRVQAADHDSPEFLGNQSADEIDVEHLSNIDRYYWRVDEIGAGGQITRGAVWYFRSRKDAFPGAEGYGRFAIGGRGGQVVHVTNLNDAGPGSLRDAVETDRGPRTIVFDVSGIIQLKSRLTLNQSYVTVAGQTAPGKGIVVRSAPFGVAGSTDVALRHLRVRLGAGPTYDGMGLTGATHSIVDHASISWTIDEGFSSRSAKHITLQRTLISECLNIANHQNYPAGTKHGYAGTISGNVGSFHHNLLAHCEGRNFSMGSAIDGNNVFNSRLDLFNNVVYNHGGRANDGQVHEANFVGNYYKKGPATKIEVMFSMDLENYGQGTLQAYLKDNVLQNTNGSFACDGTNQACGRRFTLSNGNPAPTWNVFPTAAPLFDSLAHIDSARDAFKSVLSDVGNTIPVFDDHDIRVVKETLNGTTTYTGSRSGVKGLPDSEADVGGYESYPKESRPADWDSDGDGLPDWWELAGGTNPQSEAGDFVESNTDFEGDGYTELEEYLAFAAAPHFVTTPGTSVSVDLPKLFVGYTKSPSYTSPAAVGGTVSISGGKATFTPTGCGPTSFALEVTDGDGAKMRREVFVFVDAGQVCE
ncbi:MAG TPA: thrombospondin type 3 repeat-containing protein [Polyangiaceae bacterium]|nr:thrombospondin type 3 repeat-containing protein [Polyangiaceae bacterium]